MFIILLANPDPMGGGSPYHYVGCASTFGAAEKRVNELNSKVPLHEKSWVNYVISQVVG